VQQVQQQGGGGVVGRGDDGKRLGAGGGRGRGFGMPGGLPADMSDAEMARYMRTQGGMQLPGSHGESSDAMMRTMMGGGSGAGTDGGLFGMPGGAGGGSFAPFARHPPSEFGGMDRVPDRMGGGGAEGTWLPEQGGLRDLGMGGSTTQGMVESGGKDRDMMESGGAGMWPPMQLRPSGGLDGLSVGGPGMLDGREKDRDPDLRPSDGPSAGGERMLSADQHPPTDLVALPEQQQQQQQQQQVAYSL